MAQIESIDWPGKRFFLHIDTVTSGFDAWEAFAEVRALQEANLNNEQNFRLWIHREGKVPKDLTGTRFTARYVTVDSGWRGVPHPNGGTEYGLELLVEMLNPVDGVSDAGAFDRSSVATNVDIDATYSQVEIIAAGGGGSGLSQQQVRDALTLAPSVGVAAADSIDDRLDELAIELDNKTPLNAAATRAALGLVSPNLDEQLSGGGLFDALVDGHTAPGTFGRYIVAAATRQAVVIDGGPNLPNLQYDAAGRLLRGRLRFFRDQDSADAATLGADTAEPGELFAETIGSGDASIGGSPSALQNLRWR